MTFDGAAKSSQCVENLSEAVKDYQLFDFVAFLLEQVTVSEKVQKFLDVFLMHCHAESSIVIPALHFSTNQNATLSPILSQSNTTNDSLHNLKF